MPWTVSVTIYTEDSRMDLEPPYRRPAGTIMNVSLPTRKGGYGPDTIYGLIDITGVPDTVTLERLRNFLIQEWPSPVERAVLLAWRDCEVIYTDLPTALRRDLTSEAKKHRGTITWVDFLAVTTFKSRGRRLTDADVPRVGRP